MKKIAPFLIIFSAYSFANEDNSLQCKQSVMQKIYENDKIATCKDSTNKILFKGEGYYMCDIIHKGCESISERLAKTSHQIDIPFMITETNVFLDDGDVNRFSFECNGENNIDIYSSGSHVPGYSWDIVDYSYGFMNSQMQFIIHNPTRDRKDIMEERFTIYQCRKASFFEKTKMKIHFMKYK